MASEAGWDAIYIRDLALRCVIGIFPEERREKQDVIINVVMYGELRKACRSDQIEDTINYKSVKLRILEMVEKSRFFLLERLAEEVAVLCFEQPLVSRVTVTVDKPAALRFARSVAVEITRDRLP